MKKVILCFFTFAIGSAVILLMGYRTKSNTRIFPAKKAVEKGFVIMELFTSQGCSSCPPADEILGTYARANDEHIIPIAFHVDYWNRLGWTDSLSNRKFTDRQQDYAKKFKLESVYTPQLIINGQTELVGSEQNTISGIVNDFLNAPPAIKISATVPVIIGNKLTVTYTVNRIEKNVTICGALVRDNITTYIKAGENRGRKLNNYCVVRDFASMRLSGAEGSIMLDLPKGDTVAGYSIVLFVQDSSSGKITGAMKIRL